MTLRTALFLATTMLGPLAANAGTDEFLQLTSRARAYHENRQFAEAVTLLKKAAAIRPDDPLARTNLAAAHLADNQLAEMAAELREAERLKADTPTIWYLWGLCHALEGRFPEAQTALERAAQLDPHTPAIRFQLGQAYGVLGRDDLSEREMHETIRLDPLHGGAYNKLQLLARRQGKLEEQKKLLAEFLRVQKIIGSNVPPELYRRCHHTEIILPPPPPDSPPPLDVSFVVVTPLESSASAPASQAAPAGPGRAVAVFDPDADGAWNLLVEQRGRLLLARRMPAGAYEPVTGFAGPAVAPSAIAVADCDNDGFVDLYLASPVGGTLLRRTGSGQFTDATESAGLAGVRAIDAAWVEWDHSGFVDLFVVTDEGKVRLFRRRTQPAFEDISAAAGIPDALGGAQRLALADVNGDEAPDLVVTGMPQQSVVLLNRREGKFSPMPDPPGPWPPASVVAVDDVDNDGRADVLLAADGSATLILGRGGKRATFAYAGGARDAAMFDYDNDGRTDVLIATSDANLALRLWRNLGNGVWDDVSAMTGLAQRADRATPLSVRRVAHADLDRDGDTDVLVGTDAGPLLLRNDGGSARRQLSLKLTGVKSNRSGRGVHVEVRAGGYRAARLATQDNVEIGTGGLERVDVVRTAWPNGIVHNTFDVPVSPGATVEIKQPDVMLGSCPYLYAWNGQTFEFVTDILGAAPLGLPYAPGRYLPADTDEIVRIGPVEQFPADRRRFRLVATDQLRETLYLDMAALLVVDHPLGVEVWSSDKLMSPPFPPSRVVGTHNPRPPTAATDDAGNDWTAAVRRIDGRLTRPPARSTTQLRGFTRRHTLDLTFDSIDPAAPNLLVLTGWLQYGDASVNIALADDPDAVLPPRLSARTRDDQWHVVDANLGLPAGKTKTIVVDLSRKLPFGTTALRLETSFEVYWDRIVLAAPMPEEQIRLTQLAPVVADLRFLGFPRHERAGEDHPLVPRFEPLSPDPPWGLHMSGWCTRYGDVAELVQRVDDRFVIAASGDAVFLEFDATRLEPPPAGMSRTLFFHSDGWDKDMDYRVAAGTTVEPLPRHGPNAPEHGPQGDPPASANAAVPEDGTDWHVRFNTRWVGPTERLPD